MRILALVVASFLVGCVANEPSPQLPNLTESLNVHIAPPIGEASAVQTSRYVFERRAPAEELTNILSVPVDVRLPVMSNMTIKESMNFMLNGSGVRLRTPASYGEAQLFNQPLPLIQTDMGNMPLRQALQIMAGPAFVLEEDIVKREVGFSLKKGYTWIPPKYDEVLMSPRLKTSLSNTIKTASANANVVAAAEIKEVKKKPKPSISRDDDSIEQKNNERFSASSAANALLTSPLSKSIIPKTKRLAFRVHSGERYRSALLRWVHRSGADNVAIAQEPDFLRALDNLATRDFAISGSLEQAVAALSLHDPTLSELTLYSLSKKGMVALHPYKNEAVTLFNVQGKTLQAAVKGVVKHYRWYWDDNDSWSVDDYPFPASYPLVTRIGDISKALAIVLKQYPLEARRLDATKTIYIREATPL